MLDLRKLDTITVDAQAGTATVGAGVQLIDLYSRLAPAGVTVPGGSCPSVGIAGVTLGGGFGLASRHLGLTIDSLRAVRIVTADGALRSVDSQSDSDLLWALKGGGGGNFGVVTEFTFATHPIPAASTFFKVAWPWSSASAAIEAWQSWAPHTNEKITCTLHVETGGPHDLDHRPVLRPVERHPGAGRAAAEASRGQRSPARRSSPTWTRRCCSRAAKDAALAWCHTSGAAPGGQLPREIFQAKSDYVVNAAPGGRTRRDDRGGRGAGLGSPALRRVRRRDRSGRRRPDRVHPPRALFCIQYYSGVAATGWVDQAWTKMRPFVSGGAYQNYIDPHLKGWEQAYYGSNLTRLKATRARIDPHHYFNFPQAIGR